MPYRDGNAIRPPRSVPDARAR
ncbi:hypothetical protein BOS5A_180079 [Bosea sp. EC-HK365B]|nr:hypothetical protein BOSE21B_80082 [Bosea sp. 21B]CAD5300044.1 hypothetical protein BOSE7B_60727 [Bosea sp. 7B]VVT57151.1 hypothetical protein BOS5A_180079 [Bosea sp. EC-HK365B]VXB50055.1 hypothetical protein BOSE127_120191 [Bosea sp. 127]VXC69103.1 hypothetical protein BOSE29B_70057 [Bosea sp. 29B]